MKTIGLACVGGGTKAASNIGVIKAFNEAGIKISAISGTSCGSIIAVMYALGCSPEEMLVNYKKYTKAFPKYSLIDKIKAPFLLVSRGGGKDPKVISKMLDEFLKTKSATNMKDLNMPVFIPTLDITNKKTVYYSSTNLQDEDCYLDRKISEAIKSSSSLPLLYVPNDVYINGELHQFLDGGMTNNTPTTHLHDFADIVIGVENKYYKYTNNKKVNLITGIRNTFQGMRRSAVVFQKKDADLWILADCQKVDFIHGTSDDVDNCFQAGYEATRELIRTNIKTFLE